VTKRDLDDASVAALRHDLYALLSAMLLAPPGPEACAALADPDTRAVVTALLGDGAREALDVIASEPFTEALRATFFEVFAVPGARYKPPFESVYCDAREVAEGVVGGLLLGPSSDAVRRAYAAAGFEAAGELPDHLGVELAFLAALAAREREALTRCDADSAAGAAREAITFATDHPARWAATFASRVATDDDARFFAAVARLAAALVDETVARAHARRTG
jgi:TorA maturation chaperone TorD